MIFSLPSPYLIKSGLPVLHFHRRCHQPYVLHRAWVPPGQQLCNAVTKSSMSLVLFATDQATCLRNTIKNDLFIERLDGMDVDQLHTDASFRATRWLPWQSKPGARLLQWSHHFPPFDQYAFANYKVFRHNMAGPWRSAKAQVNGP